MDIPAIRKKDRRSSDFRIPELLFRLSSIRYYFRAARFIPDAGEFSGSGFVGPEVLGFDCEVTLEVTTMNVVVYTMHGWSGCHHAKEFLSRNGVQFTERNVSEDLKAREELLAMGFRAVPVIKVDSQTILGFDPQKLKPLLGLKG
jgi:glutaredoxin 3